ncbi:glutamate-1-semialdehyde 2,1-aminomutase [Sanguibacter gelidistatuariae]
MIPGGSHTYARSSDQYPEGMAPVIARGRGARVLDVDGNWFVEYGMGMRAVTLGHGYEPVVDAVSAAIRDGVSFTRPSVWEARAAETFLNQFPGAEMVKFAKNGSDVTSAAVKIARAATGRDLVAICETQPFFSTDDWFIGATGMGAGVPQAVRDLTVGFRYNDLESLRAVLDANLGQVACVILEQATATAEPHAGFLEGVRELCDEHGVVLIFDEMITGLRWHAGGAQAIYGVQPDLATWGKALGNGFAISALSGKRKYMELGGLNTDESRVFLLSTTHGPEVVGLAAYVAVAQAYQSTDVVGLMEARGRDLADGINNAAQHAGIGSAVEVIGRPSCLVFATRDQTGAPSQAFRTLFIQEMLRAGVLGQSFVISAAHTPDDIETTVDAAAQAFAVYAKALDNGSTHGLLQGRPVAPAMREFAAPRRLPDEVSDEGVLR